MHARLDLPATSVRDVSQALCSRLLHSAASRDGSALCVHWVFGASMAHPRRERAAWGLPPPSLYGCYMRAHSCQMRHL